MRQRQRRSILLRVTLVLALAGPAWAQPTQPAATQPTGVPGLDRLRSVLLESYKGGDVTALLPYLDPEIVIVFPDGEILRGHQALLDYVARKNSIVASYTNAPEILHRELRGDAVLTYGKMHDRYALKDGRGTIDLDSRFTVTAAKSANGPAETEGWVIRSFHQSADAFANPIVGMAARKALTYGVVGGAIVGVIAGAVGGVLIGRKLRSRS